MIHTFDFRSKNCLFDFEWQGDGTVAIKASNNNYIFNKPTGSLSATSESIGEKEKFCVRMVNHPTLVLKGEFGFIGLKSTSGQKSEIVCNKATFDTVNLEANESGGCYKFRGEKTIILQIIIITFDLFFSFSSISPNEHAVLWGQPRSDARFENVRIQLI